MHVKFLDKGFNHTRGLLFTYLFLQIWISVPEFLSFVIYSISTQKFATQKKQQPLTEVRLTMNLWIRSGVI